LLLDGDMEVESNAIARNMEIVQGRHGTPAIVYGDAPGPPTNSGRTAQGRLGTNPKAFSEDEDQIYAPPRCPNCGRVVGPGRAMRSCSLSPPHGLAVIETEPRN